MKNIEFALTCIEIMHTSALRGQLSYEEAKAISMKHWENENLTKDLVISHFTKEHYKNQTPAKIKGLEFFDTPVPVNVLREISSTQWNALEYFDLI